jgi:hypothetical protein
MYARTIRSTQGLRVALARPWIARDLGETVENALSCACTRAQCSILVPDVSEYVLDVSGPVRQRPIFVDGKIAATMLAGAPDS